MICKCENPQPNIFIAEGNFCVKCKNRIIYKEMPENNGTIVIIASDNNRYLEKSISDFVESCPDEILQKVNSERTTDGNITEFLMYLSKYFPFLEFSQEE